MADIHPTAIIHDGAQIEDGASIGPFCIVGPNVKIASRARLISHVSVLGKTVIGENCELFQNVVVGARGQILGSKDNIDAVEIGARTILREHVTVHGSSAGKSEPTRIGADCFMMVNTHVGHDAQIGNKCVFANNVMIGGHAIIADQVWMGGAAGVHQNTWIGEHAFIAAGCFLTGDTVPYVMAEGAPSFFKTLNAVGLARRGFTRGDIKDIRNAILYIFAGDEGTFETRTDKASADMAGNSYVDQIVSFVRHPRNGRKLCQYRK